MNRKETIADRCRVAIGCHQATVRIKKTPTVELLMVEDIVTKSNEV